MATDFYEIVNHWSETDTSGPQVIHVCNVARDTLLPDEGMQSLPRWWSMDCFFTPVRIKTGSVRARWIDRTPYEIWMYPPNFKYWEDTTHVKPPVCSCWVLFKGGEEAGLERFTRNRAGFARFLDSEHTISDAILEMASLNGTNDQSRQWRARAALCRIIATFEEAHQVSEGLYTIVTTHSRSAILRERADKYLREHLSEHITLEGIAAHLNVSVSTLCHQYRSETGTSPMKMLIRLRIGVARGLIVRGHPLKHVAAETGFSNEFHLSRTFKQLEGVSTRTFLQRQQAQG